MKTTLFRKKLFAFLIIILVCVSNQAHIHRRGKRILAKRNFFTKAKNMWKNKGFSIREKLSSLKSKISNIPAKLKEATYTAAHTLKESLFNVLVKAYDFISHIITTLIEESDNILALFLIILMVGGFIYICLNAAPIAIVLVIVGYVLGKDKKIRFIEKRTEFKHLKGGETESITNNIKEIEEYKDAIDLQLVESISSLKERKISCNKNDNDDVELTVQIPHDEVKNSKFLETMKSLNDKSNIKIISENSGAYEFKFNNYKCHEGKLILGNKIEEAEANANQNLKIEKPAISNMINEHFRKKMSEDNLKDIPKDCCTKN